jgi:hypothetical protein
MDAVKLGASLTSKFRFNDEGRMWNWGVGLLGTEKSSTHPPYHSVAGINPIVSVTSSSRLIDQEPLGEIKPLILLEPLKDEVKDSHTN